MAVIQPDENLFEESEQKDEKKPAKSRKKKVNKKRTRFTLYKQNRFLELLKTNRGVFAEACRQIKVAPETVRYHYHKNPKFKLAVDTAVEQGRHLEAMHDLDSTLYMNDLLMKIVRRIDADKIDLDKVKIQELVNIARYYAEKAYNVKGGRFGRGGGPATIIQNNSVTVNNSGGMDLSRLTVDELKEFKRLQAKAMVHLDEEQEKILLARPEDLPKEGIEDAEFSEVDTPKQ